jgi:type IV pilus assembly protein PilE
MRRVKQENGFTLIELMITVAIIAVIAAIAYPSYTSYIVRTKRSAAQSFMMTVANKEEQAMLNARSYFSVASSSDWSTASMSVPDEVSATYTVSVAVTTSTLPAFTVTAVANATQAARDPKCKDLTYSSTGVKGINGTGTVAECWR